MTLRDHILSAVDALTPGQRDMFAWIVLALALVAACAVIGAIVGLEGILWTN